MDVLDDILFEAINVDQNTSLNNVVATIERPLIARGASHILVCGLPMPSRAVDPLLIRIKWGDVRSTLGSLVSIPAGDPAIDLCRDSMRPFAIENDALPQRSHLVAATGFGTVGTLVAIPCRNVPYYQGAVIAMGRSIHIDEIGLMAFDFLAARVFRRLAEIGVIVDGRPGELSERERSVVALSARGRTANEIAEVLGISQRTVHAHLQNAADKLRAANKTQTVVEALRYGQLSMRDIPVE